MKTQEILLLEDNPDTLAGTVAELESRGFGVDQVKYLDDAMERLREKEYDAVLLDWRVPDRAGEAVNADAGGDLLMKLSAGALGPKNQDVSVVIVTAQARAVNHERISQHKQCLGIVPKMQFSRMMATVEEALSRKTVRQVNRQTVSSPGPAQDVRQYLPVKVVSFEGQRAFCKARFQGFWLRIALNRASLEDAGLQEGDVFEWAPNEDGIVRSEDVRLHPHKIRDADFEKTQKVFSQLNELTKQSKG